MQHTFTVTRTRELHGCPDWVQYALEGQKINAIKSLREVAIQPGHGTYNDRKGEMGLLEAKRIVEDFMKHIVETETRG